MAIFNKANQQTDYSSNVTTISAGARITGKIDIECELHIDGEVEAEINSTGLVKIGQSGVVNSNNLRANTLIVSGKFLGDVECESVEIVAGGDVKGKLTAVNLAIDTNGSFQGESIRKEAADSSVSVSPRTTTKNKADKPDPSLFIDKADYETKN